MSNTTHRAMPNPGTEVPVRVTGEGLRALRLACLAQKAAAEKTASDNRLKAERTEDKKLASMLLKVAKTFDEQARIAGGLAAELEAAHKGQDPLVGNSIDDVRRAEYQKDLETLKAKGTTP